MDAATRELVRRQKVAREEDRASERRRRILEAQVCKQAMLAEKQAAAQVDRVAQETAERLAIEPSRWLRDGVLEKVCNCTGPHSGFRCLFHRKKLVTLLQIPGARGGCYSCSHSRRSYSKYRVEQHRCVYLGSDGKVYRYGHTKIFRAKLTDRHNVKAIIAIAKKIKAME